MKKVLTPKYAINLYKKNQYTIPVDTIINSIYEYDISQAGLSMVKEYKLLSNYYISLLEEMDKIERNIAIGKITIRNKELAEGIKNGILNARVELVRNNSIKEDEILSIKNDAIFIMGRTLSKNRLSENVSFNLKNIYTSFHRVEKIEYYYNSKKDILDVKGINDNMRELHKDGILSFLSSVFYMVEYEMFDKLKAYLIEFANSYKEKSLPVQYYREYNSESKFIYSPVSGGENEYNWKLDNVDKTHLEQLDIRYNYLSTILPILNKYIY